MSRQGLGLTLSHVSAGQHMTAYVLPDKYLWIHNDQPADPRLCEQERNATANRTGADHDDAGGGEPVGLPSGRAFNERSPVDFSDGGALHGCACGRSQAQDLTSGNSSLAEALPD